MTHSRCTGFMKLMLLCMQEQTLLETVRSKAAAVGGSCIAAVTPGHARTCRPISMPSLGTSTRNVRLLLHAACAPRYVTVTASCRQQRRRCWRQAAYQAARSRTSWTFCRCVCWHVPQACRERRALADLGSAAAQADRTRLSGPCGANKPSHGHRTLAFCAIHLSEVPGRLA